MQKLSNSKLISIATTFLVLLLLAKILSLVAWWYLPSEGVELNAKKSYRATYQRVDFKNILIRAKVVEAQQSQKESSESSSGVAYSINSMVLKGLYGSKFSGFAIVAKKSQEQETSIVAVGEVYEGYKLKEINIDHVVFRKNAKDYRLNLAESKVKYRDALRDVVQTQENLDEEENSEHIVTREDIKYYSRNPAKIWKDIAISPVKRGKKIVGFRVTRIKKGSKMAQLGLQKGDIMIRANNIKLTSFNDAIKLYKKIDKIETIAIVVLRNNEEKEIIYEIH